MSDERSGWLFDGRRRVELDGQLHPAFEGVARCLREQLESTPGGAAVCIYHRGRRVVDLWGGARDKDQRPWLEDTMSPSFSTTKGVASTLLHMMVDRGLLDYDDRVAKHWPEFGRAGKQEITVRHVMAHQSGLYHIRQMIDRAERMVDWEYMIEAIERAEPVHAPGARTGYHGLTFGYLVGEILQRATGVEFAKLVRQELAAPLGLDGLYIGAPPDELHRAADLIWPKRHVLAPVLPPRVTRRFMELTAPALREGSRRLGLEVDVASILDSLAPRGIGRFDFGADETLQASIPAANGLFTARSLAKIYAALAGGGEIDGVRLLSTRALRRATTRQRTTSGGLAVIPFDMRWRLGYHGVFTTIGSPSHAFGHFAFGHFGFGGSGAWADPSRDLAVALIVNSGIGTPFGDLRIARLSAAALRCADRRAGTVQPFPSAEASRSAAIAS